MIPLELGNVEFHGIYFVGMMSSGLLWISYARILNSKKRNFYTPGCVFVNSNVR